MNPKEKCWDCEHGKHLSGKCQMHKTNKKDPIIQEIHDFSIIAFFKQNREILLENYTNHIYEKLNFNQPQLIEPWYEWLNIEYDAVIESHLQGKITDYNL